MTDERFNELLAGRLCHPLPMFTLTRVVLALRDVVKATGKPGEEALERHCAERHAQDVRNGEDV